VNNLIKCIFILPIFSTLLFSCSINRPTVTQLIPDPPLFMVAYPLRYETNDGNLKIVVPAGFITDLASIPSALWWWESPHETTLAPAIIHDYLYWQQTCSKDESDAVMYLAMKELGLGYMERKAVYAGIRTPFAQSAWDENESARVGGESRFFTKEYTHIIMDSAISPDTTLMEIQQKAISNDGMFSPPEKNENLKAACEAALLKYNL